MGLSLYSGGLKKAVILLNLFGNDSSKAANLIGYIWRVIPGRVYRSFKFPVLLPGENNALTAQPGRFRVAWWHVFQILRVLCQLTATFLPTLRAISTIALAATFNIISNHLL